MNAPGPGPILPSQLILFHRKNPVNVLYPQAPKPDLGHQRNKIGSLNKLFF